MRIGSLFSGYGGLERGVQAVIGGATAWVSDVDPGANRLLAHRHPDVPNLGDITAVDWAQVEPVNVLTAGYPCQPFSKAGNQLEAADVRYLWPEVARAVRVLGPGLVVLENVRGHVVRGFSEVVGSLVSLGYDCRWTCIRAADVGAPHPRERLFAVAWPAPDPSGERHGRRQDPRGVGPVDRRDEGEAPQRQRTREVPRYRSDAATTNPDRTGLEGRGAGKRRDERLAGPDSLVDWGEYGPAIRRWECILGRPAPAPTEPGRTGKAQLSPRFSEFLMGLPAGWVTDVPGLSRNDQLKLLGNGVVPQQAEAALQVLLGERRARAAA